jgi:hypothetical protein
VFWMLVVETIAKIRRLSLVQGKSIKAICRELKISRKVVRESGPCFFAQKGPLFGVLKGTPVSGHTEL